MSIRLRLAKIERDVDRSFQKVCERLFDGRTEEDLEFLADHGYWPEAAAVKHDEHQLETKPD